MAFVKILAANLFAGTPAKRLEVGAVYEIPDGLAGKWVAAGKAKTTSKVEGAVKLTTLSVSVAQPGQIFGTVEQTDSPAITPEMLEAATRRGDEAEAALQQLKADMAEQQKQYEASLSEATRRGDEAIERLSALKKKEK